MRELVNASDSAVLRMQRTADRRIQFAILVRDEPGGPMRQVGWVNLDQDMAEHVVTEVQRLLSEIRKLG